MVGFITGFPRSRTCWLATALFVPGLCHVSHELSVAYEEPWDVVDRIKRNQVHVPNIAVESSSAILLKALDFIDHFIGSRTPFVLIQRESADAMAAYIKAFDGLLDPSQIRKIWPLLESGMKAFEDSGLNLMKVPYESLSDTDVVMSIGEFLDGSFPKRHRPLIELLQKRKIVQCLNPS